MSELFMGLDLSCTATGIVVIDADGLPVSYETVGSSLSRKAPQRDRTERLIEIATKVVGAMQRTGCRNVAIEGASFNARGNQFDLGEVHGCVKTQLWLSFHVIPLVVPCSSARQVAVGKLKGVQKGTVKRRVAELLADRLTKWPDLLSDEDLVDAYVVAEWARKKWPRRT